MKLISLNSRESNHVLDLGFWEILFAYGQPIGAWEKTDHDSIYKTSEVLSLAQTQMFDRYFEQVASRCESPDMGFIVIEPDEFDIIIKGKFEK